MRASTFASKLLCICPVLSEGTSLTESVLFTDLQLYCVSGTGNSGKSIYKDAFCYHENFNSSAAKEAIISVLANSLDWTPELHKSCKEHCCNHYWKMISIVVEIIIWIVVATEHYRSTKPVFRYNIVFAMLTISLWSATCMFKEFVIR